MNSPICPTRQLRTGLILAAFVFLSAFAFARAAEQPAGKPAFSVSFDGASIKDAHDVAVKTALQYHWEIVTDTADKVVIHHKRHGHEGTITLMILDKSVEAFAVGDPAKNWISNLEVDMRKNLAAYRK
jgi:hypothetical protein